MNSYSKIVKPNINQLIHDNTNLVKKISWHLHGRVSAVIEIEDIIQIGMLVSSQLLKIIHLKMMLHLLHMLALGSEVKFLIS